jgi:hypothetical protein
MEQTPVRPKALMIASMFAMTALTGLATLTTFAAPVAAHDCYSMLPGGCGECVSGTHTHDWAGGRYCNSSCPSSGSCDPGTGQPITYSVHIKKLANYSLARNLAACNAASSVNYTDGGWISFAGESGRTYQTSSSSGLQSGASFYRLSGGNCVQLDSNGYQVPQGTNYVLLEAIAGEGDATIVTSGIASPQR